jgi:hypothetical protein
MSLEMTSSSLFLGTFVKLQNATIIFVISGRLSAWNSSATTRRLFIKFDVSVIFGRFVEKIKDLLKSDRNNGTLIENLCLFMKNFAVFFIKLEMVQTNLWRKSKPTFYVQ